MVADKFQKDRKDTNKNHVRTLHFLTSNKPPKSMHCCAGDVFPGLNSASRHGDVTIPALGGRKPSLERTAVCSRPNMMLTVSHVQP